MQTDMISRAEAQAHLNAAIRQRNDAMDALVSVDSALNMAQDRIKQLEAQLAVKEANKDVQSSENPPPNNQSGAD